MSKILLERQERGKSIYSDRLANYWATTRESHVPKISDVQKVESVRYSRYFADQKRRHELMKSLKSYNVAIEVSQTRLELYYRIGNDERYQEIFTNHAHERISMIFSKIRFTNLTTGLVGGFVLLLAVSISLGVVGYLKGSTGLAESALFVLAGTFLTGIFASDRIESEFRVHHG